MATGLEGDSPPVVSCDPFCWRGVVTPCRRKGDDTFLFGPFFDEALFASASPPIGSWAWLEEAKELMLA